MQLFVTNFEKFKDARVHGDQALDKETLHRYSQYYEKPFARLDEASNL
jgi:hypothetical protein